MKEIERRFLLKFIPDEIRGIVPVEIEDAKIITGELHPHLRLRRKNEHRELTKKYRPDGAAMSEMIEETIELNAVEFDTLKKLDHTGQIKKRYVVEKDQYKMELDLWMGELGGLGIVEFEFDEGYDIDSFEIPEYCLVEITGVESLAGGMVSGRKYEDIKPILDKYNYQKLN